MPTASKQASGTSVKPAACWPYAMPCLSKHTFLGLFTVPKALVVSGDTTSFAGFSSGTSGLGYLDATNFQKQDGDKSLFKIFQTTLEYPPGRKESL